MTAHTKFCLLDHAWGDMTLEAVRRAIGEALEEEGGRYPHCLVMIARFTPNYCTSDDYFVILISDANLDQYSITSDDLKELIHMHQRVNVYMLFIGK